MMEHNIDTQPESVRVLPNLKECQKSFSHSPTVSKWKHLLWSAVAVGLFAFAPHGFAQNILLEWDASPSPDVVSYRVHYGTVSGNYLSSTNVGDQTEATIPGLQSGMRYYFAATAVNYTGLESVPSEEISFQMPSAPTVALTSPTSGTSYAAPANINLAASVTANGQTISSVRFFNGTTLLGSDAAAPYNFSWDNVGAGNYSVTAQAVYGTGSTVNSSAANVSVTNVPTALGLSFAPTEGTISSPFVASNGTIYQPAETSLASSGRATYDFYVSAAGDYTVTADVNAPSDSQNSFFVNIDGEPTDPAMTWHIPVTSGFQNHTVSWSGGYGVYPPKVFTLSAGMHQLIVRGREGNTVLGRITIVPVNNVVPPVVSLTSPSNGAAYTAPANIDLGASVTANGNTINKVQFFNGASFLGEDANAPYNFSWSNVSAGDYVLSAKVVYNSTNTVTSESATVVVTNSVSLPAIALTSPTSGASFNAPAEITIAADVTANGNSINKVQFFNGTTLLGEDASAPYNYSWSSVGPGSYKVSATAIYGTGNVVTSSSTDITVKKLTALPAPWETTDIGAIELAGEASESNGVFTVTGSGALASTADSFRFVYQPLSGDGEILCKVRPVGTTGAGGAFGVIIRESLAPGSTYAYMGVLRTGKFRWQQRNRTSGLTGAKTLGKNTTADLWVRIVRSGSTLTGYQSNNGKTWSAAGSVNIAMAENISVGFAVASGSATTLETSSFSNVVLVP